MYFCPSVRQSVRQSEILSEVNSYGIFSNSVGMVIGVWNFVCTRRMNVKETRAVLNIIHWSRYIDYEAEADNPSDQAKWTNFEGIIELDTAHDEWY